jgi:hypothetical protein
VWDPVTPVTTHAARVLSRTQSRNMLPQLRAISTLSYLQQEAGGGRGARWVGAAIHGGPKARSTGIAVRWQLVMHGRAARFNQL